MLIPFLQNITGYFRKKKYKKIKSFPGLDPTEQRIIEEISIGKSYRTIAEELSISKDDVQIHIRSVYKKLRDKSDI